MTAEFLAGVAGIILSLVFSYVPKSEGAWSSLEGTYKRLIMLGLLALVALGAFGLACASLGGDFGIKLTCDKAGLIGLVQVLGAAVIANQAAFAISPKK